MKKTYRPMARTEKASQMFKKKTLNVNDDLNIKHDEDDIENVDAYWSTAMSVIGNSTIDSIDDTVVTEQSDTLFNINSIRKSIRGDYKESAEDLYRECVDESKRKESRSGTRGGAGHENGVEEAASSGQAIPGEDIANSENFENSIKKKVRRLTLKGDDSSQIDRRDPEEEQYPAGFDADVPDSNSELRKPDVDFCMEASISSSEEKMPDSGFEIELDNLLDYSNVKENGVDQKGDKMEESVAELKSLSSFLAKPRSSSTPQKVENYRVKDHRTTNKARKRERLEIQEIPSITTVNSVKPLVCSSSMDTAVMNLDYLAYVENHETANAFSIYVIKGKAELTVNSGQKVISKGNIAVIEKGDVYSLNCLSRNGALLLLSYVL